MKIVHLSDLHCTSPLFVSQWGDAVVSYLEEARPDLTVVTGDLTMDGRRDEYRRALLFLARLRTRSLLVVPGNHDTRNGGYLRFEEVFGTRFPTYTDETVVICGVDSSQPDLDVGHVGRSTLAQMADMMSIPGRTRILAVHHHLVPIPGDDPENPIPDNAEEVLKLCSDAGVDIVLAGHGHRPHFCSHGSTRLVTAGSATLLRPGGQDYPSFNVIRIERDTFCLQHVDVTGGWGTQTIATTKVRHGVTVGTTRPRVMPPMPFEVEEFHTQIPEENWRYRLGVPQTLDFPSARD
jgi:3',5'-cyclic AMP phosphodiesterase CpdA